MSRTAVSELGAAKQRPGENYREVPFCTYRQSGKADRQDVRQEGGCPYTQRKSGLFLARLPAFVIAAPTPEVEFRPNPQLARWVCGRRVSAAKNSRVLSVQSPGEPAGSAPRFIGTYWAFLCHDYFLIVFD
jgi:hypothetical protein